MANVTQLFCIIDDGFPILWMVIDSNIEMDWRGKEVNFRKREAHFNLGIIHDCMRKNIKKQKIQNFIVIIFIYMAFIYITVNFIKYVWSKDRVIGNHFQTKFGTSSKVSTNTIKIILILLDLWFHYWLIVKYYLLHFSSDFKFICTSDSDVREECQF